MSISLHHRVPLLLLVAVVGGVWWRTGAPPLQAAGPWATRGLALLLLGLFVRLLAPSVGAPRWLRSLGAVAAAVGFACWLLAVGRVAVQGPRAGGTRLVLAALLGYALWGWWQQRRLRSPRRTDAVTPEAS